MSRAEPKHKQLSLGVGKYYNPVTSRASLKHNARVAFLQAVENKTPGSCGGGKPWRIFGLGHYSALGIIMTGIG